MARSFNGTDNHLDWANILNPKQAAFTFACWVNIDNYLDPTTESIFSVAQAGDAADMLRIYHNGGQLAAIVYASSGNNIARVGATGAGNVLPLDTWTHLAVTFDGTAAGTGWHFYINGTETGYASSSSNTDAANQVAGAGSWSLGSLVHSDNYGIDGIIALPGYWSAVLDAPTITGLAAGNAPVTYPTKLEWYPPLSGANPFTDPITTEVGTDDGTIEADDPTFAGTITGTITCAKSGLPIINAVVTVNGVATITNPNGAYTSGSIAMGTYANSTIAATGYTTETFSATIPNGTALTKNQTLTPAAKIGTVTKSATSVAKYEMLQLTFPAYTTAKQPYLLYDASPPAGITAEIGCTITGLFSDDNWDTTLTMPAFLYQPMSRTNLMWTATSRDHIYPTAEPYWMVRFAPPREGVWAYKIRVLDADGTTDSTAGSFLVTAATGRGWPKVSATDSRYFETADGTVLPLTGLQDGSGNDEHYTYTVDDRYADYADRGMLLRRWFNEAQGPWIFGAGNSDGSNVSWANSPGIDVAAGTTVARSAAPYYEIFSNRLNANNESSGLNYVPVLADHTYRFAVSVKTVGLTGAVTQSVDYDVAGATYGSITTADADYTEITTTFTADATHNYVKLILTMTGTGAAYHTGWSLREVNDDGTYGPEILGIHCPNRHLYANQQSAYQGDYYMQTAADSNAYVKMVVNNIKDSVYGAISSAGVYETRADSNVIASADHASRWYQECFWRYMYGRYAAYNSLHSFECWNEGEYLDGDYEDCAEAFSTYMHAAGSRPVLTTTSWFRGFPMDFYKTCDFDYVDFHEYTGDRLTVNASNGARYMAWEEPRQASTTNLTVPRTTVVSARTYGTIALDTAEYHSGAQCLKLVALEYESGEAEAIGTALLGTHPLHVPIDPTHSLTLSYWAKTSSVQSPAGGLAYLRPYVAMAYSRAYHENDYTGKQTEGVDGGLPAAQDTAGEWVQYSATFTPGTDATPDTGLDLSDILDSNTLNLYIRCPRGSNGEGSGTFWIDDLSLIDNDTGEELMVDGGFEGAPITEDTALATERYCKLLGGYAERLGLPAIWAETGIRGQNLYGTPFKGYAYSEESQRYAVDTDGVWLKKMLWPSIEYGVVVMPWHGRTTCIEPNSLHGLFGAVHTFLSGLPLNNGRYVDAEAMCSSGLRAYGQKDVDGGRAHLWIDNIAYDFDAVVDSSIDLATDAAWANGKTYAVGSICTNGGNTYTSVDAHTASAAPAVFSDDSAHWTLVGATAANPALPDVATGWVDIPDMPTGEYKIEKVNTSTGLVIRKSYENCTNGTLRIRTGRLTSDMAVRVTRQGRVASSVRRQRLYSWAMR